MMTVTSVALEVHVNTILSSRTAGGHVQSAGPRGAKCGPLWTACGCPIDIQWLSFYGPTSNSMNLSPIILKNSGFFNWQYTLKGAILVKKLWPIMDITEVTLCNSTSSTHIHTMSWHSTKKTHLQAETATALELHKQCSRHVPTYHSIPVLCHCPQCHSAVCRCWQAACSWAAGSAMMG